MNRDKAQRRGKTKVEEEEEEPWGGNDDRNEMIIKCFQCESDWKTAAGFSKSASKEEGSIFGGGEGWGRLQSRTISCGFDPVVHQSVEKYELKESF